MKLLGIISLVLAPALYAATPAATAGELYDSATRQLAEGKLADARADFQTLLDRYPHDPRALDAKGAIDATLLFEEGQARAKSGRCQTARVAFETLIAVYPESPLAQRAKSAIETMAGKEKDTRPVLRSVEYRHVAAIPVDEIRAQMEAREVRLNIGQPCRARDVKQAKAALAEILAEKGVAHVKVEARTRTVSPHAVAVIFTVERTHAWLWRPKAVALTD